MSNSNSAVVYDFGTFRDEVRVKKGPTEVHVTLLNGSSMRGYFYVLEGQKFADLVSDERPLMPFLDVGGAVRLLRRSSVVDVRPT